MLGSYVPSKSPLALLRFRSRFDMLITYVYILLGNKCPSDIKTNKKTVVSLFHISYREIYVSQIPSQFNSKVSAFTKSQNSPLLTQTRDICNTPRFKSLKTKSLEFKTNLRLIFFFSYLKDCNYLQHTNGENSAKCIKFYMINILST